jgi:LCP family protein required for cell wall assembly
MKKVSSIPDFSPDLPPKSDSINGWEIAQIILQAITWTAFFVVILCMLTIAGVGYFAHQKAEEFATAAGTPLPTLIETFKKGWNTVPTNSNGQITFLILGSDHLDTRGNAPVLTDTILLASLDLKSGQVSLYSLPRDLWHVEYQTRINALYTYGKDRYPTEPERFPREVIEQMGGIKVHHTYVMTLETLAKLIDQVGGVEIDVKEGFVDPQFPRSDVDVTTEHDPQKLYEIVEFQPGKQLMNGERVLKYVRSRHAAGDQGTDTARAGRQQEVILALINTIKNPNFYRDLPRLGHLYAFYIQNFQQLLPVEEAIGIARALLPYRNSISFHEATASIFPDNPQGVLVHPPVIKYNNQWVYEVRDPQAFQKEIQTQLHILPAQGGQP